MKLSAFVSFGLLIQALLIYPSFAARPNECQLFIYDGRQDINQAQRRLDRVIIDRDRLTRFERELFAKTQGDINDMRRSVGDAQKLAQGRLQPREARLCDMKENQFRKDKRDFEEHLDLLTDAMHDRRTNRSIVIERYHSPFSNYNDGFWEHRYDRRYH